MTLAERESARAAHAGSPLTVASLGLDHFKEINDTHGHAAGGLVLKTFSDTTPGLLRKSDLVGRTGGDEFLLLFPDTFGTEAKTAVEAILKALRENPIHYDGRTICLTASAGISCSDGGDFLDRIFLEADAALYDSKRAGWGRATLYRKPRVQDSLQDSRKWA